MALIAMRIGNGNALDMMRGGTELAGDRYPVALGNGMAAETGTAAPGGVGAAVAGDIRAGTAGGIEGISERYRNPSFTAGGKQVVIIINMVGQGGNRRIGGGDIAVTLVAGVFFVGRVAVGLGRIRFVRRPVFMAAVAADSTATFPDRRRHRHLDPGRNVSTIMMAVIADIVVFEVREMIRIVAGGTGCRQIAAGRDMGRMGILETVARNGIAATASRAAAGMPETIFMFMAVNAISAVFAVNIFMALIGPRAIIPVMGGFGVADLADTVIGVDAVGKRIRPLRPKKSDCLIAAVRGLDG